MTWRKTETDRKRDSRRYGPGWRKARDRAIKAANWRCEIRLQGCTGAASEVDHILGAAADPQHTALRAACLTCHRKITAQQGGGARGPADPPHEARTQW